MSGRLARARDLLRGRLARRGLALSSAGLAMALAQHALAALPATLVGSTVKAATLVATGKVALAGVVSVQAAALTEGALQAMFMSKVKFATVLVLTLTLVGTGAGVVSHHALAGKPGQPDPAARPGADDNDPAQLRDENERLRKELEQARKEITRLKELVDLFQKDAKAAREKAEKGIQLAEQLLKQAEQAAAAERDQAEAARRLAEAARAKAERQGQVSEKTHSANNLKELALAMHNYADTHHHLPPAAIYSKDGKPLLSWRVAILPYIEQDHLYRQFKLDEPWDSDHNKKLLLEKMPKVFAPVRGAKQDSHVTYYQVFTGSGTIFEGTKGIKFADITDGTSNTILIAEAGDAVPWTKPADLPYAADKPLPKLGGLFADGFNVAFADGSTLFIRKKFDEETLRLAITRNDGKEVNRDGLDK